MRNSEHPYVINCRSVRWPFPFCLKPDFQYKLGKGFKVAEVDGFGRLYILRCNVLNRSINYNGRDPPRTILHL